MAPTDHDPLLVLRQSISSSQPFIPSASADASAPEVPLSKATHLQFTGLSLSLPIDSPTRFISSDKPVDLRSIYFAWLNRELAIPEYNASATTLNDDLAANGSSGKVQNLGFIERLDLITWLEGASEESEYIKPLAGDASAAAAGAAPSSKTGAAALAAQARSGKGTIDPRLASVYDGERRMGDRNTVLRGIKPTVSESMLYLKLLARRVPVDTWLTLPLGFFSRPKTRHSLHSKEVTVLFRYWLNAVPLHQSKGPLPTPRSHHPAFSIRLVSTAHVQCPVLPRGRQVCAS